MTLVEVAILVVACFLSMVWIVISCCNSLEKSIAKYHRQELEAIDELEKSLKHDDNTYVYVQQHGDPNRCVLTPWRIEDDIKYPSHSEDKGGH